MKTSICSFAFHRGLFAGEVDAERYIELSRELGATHLHFWLPHLLKAPDLAEIRRWDWSPGSADIPSWMQAPRDRTWAADLRASAAGANLGLEMLAMEKGYAYHPDTETLRAHRAFLRPWIEFASWVGIPALRVDPGVNRGADATTVAAVAEGYRELLRIGADHGVGIYVENHWGASQDPAFLVALLDAVPDLGYLLDTCNFGSPEEREEGWRRLSSRARAVHIKTLAVDADGHDHSYPVEQAVRGLLAEGYDGIWGIESFCPPEWCSESEAVRRTMKLIARVVDGEG